MLRKKLPLKKVMVVWTMVLFFGTICFGSIGTAIAETVCECDLNGDGACNILDWPYFIEDWGKTDCVSSGEYYTKAEVDSMVADLQSQIDDLKALLAGVTRSGDDITFEGVNVHIVNGTGATWGVNGVGNLIVGYNEERISGNDRTGSHNIVVGINQNYSAFGGFVAGYGNTISSYYASVSGGSGNTASGGNSSVSGGEGNEAAGYFSSVSGGRENTASGLRSSVSGGYHNTASGEKSSVSGGEYNTASGDCSFVGGGGNSNPDHGNEAFSNYSAILGGFHNFAGDNTDPSDHTIGIGATVSGGQFNTASAWNSSVSGGIANTASGGSSSVSGGNDNIASGTRSSVSGGHKNIASGGSSSVSGGYYNTAGNSRDPDDHTKGLYATVSGGQTAIASGESSSVSGGGGNDASANVSSVSGGCGNYASEICSSVSGGRDNKASGFNSSVSGGWFNIAIGEKSSVSGGYQRTVNGLYDWRAGDLFQDE